jgi:serine/threonine protein kinase
MSERRTDRGHSPDSERAGSAPASDPAQDVLESSTPTQSQLSPARRYRVLMELGHGGMGVVRLAMSRGPRGFVKLIVLKSLHPHLAHDEDSRRRLLEEARIAACLSHPNIVQVYEVIVERAAPTIVMEYLEGQSLWALGKESDAPLPLPVHLHVLAQVLCGLHAAHTLKDFSGAPLELVHRDVSPHNVFLLYDGQVKVLDFGIAKTAASEIETRPGLARGKLQYMAPEQLSGGDVDRRVDVFSVGVMLYEAVTGRRLWQDAPDGEVALRLLNRDVPRLEDPEVAPSLRAIVNRALAANPDERYATAQELQHALEIELGAHDARSLREELAQFISHHFRQARRTLQQLVQSHVAFASEPPPPPALGDPASLPTQLAPPARRGSFALAAALLGSALLVCGAGFLALRYGAPARTPSALGAGGERVPGPCSAEQKFCDGQCVSIDRPEYGCADPGCRPCQVPNATPRCDFNQSCAIAVCYQDHDDCDGDRANGCETSVRIDPDHCGGCGKRCPELAHAERGCGDVCTIWRCEAGYADCNGRAEDGCEVATNEDPGQCGRCGAACAPGQRCVLGVCRN